LQERSDPPSPGAGEKVLDLLRRVVDAVKELDRDVKEFRGLRQEARGDY